MIKKTLLAILLSGTIGGAFAQSKSTIGIKGGLNLASLHLSEDNSNVSNGSFATFSAGAFADLRFSNFSVQPGIYYTGKGGSSNVEFVVGDIVYPQSKGKIKLYYLQAPVNLLYHLKIEDGEVYFGAGPYIATAVSGKYSVHIEEFEKDVLNRNVKFGSHSGDDIKRMDYGADALAGIKFNSRIAVDVTYNLGLSNIASSSYGQNFKFYNRVWSISLGYYF